MALAANRELNRYVDNVLRAFPVKAGAHIYKGAFVGRDAASGYARALEAGDPFEGVAYEEIDNTGGADGDVRVRVDTISDVNVPLAGAAITDRGATVYASDDETATLTSTGNSALGKLVDLADTGVVILRPKTASQL